MSYVSSAQKPTAVTLSAAGRFKSPNEINLFTVKHSYLVMYTITSEGLSDEQEIPVYGRITNICLFNPAQNTSDASKITDLLVVMTEKYDLFVLKYDSNLNQFKTLGSGNFQETIGRPSESGTFLKVDTHHSLIAVYAFEGIIKIIPYYCDPHSGKFEFKEAFGLLVEEPNIIDFCFLDGLKNNKFVTGSSYPCLCILYSDLINNARHIKTYYIDVQAKELSHNKDSKPQLTTTTTTTTSLSASSSLEGFFLSNLEGGSVFIIPIPLPMGGFLCLGEENIVYSSGHSKNQFTSLQIDPCHALCYEVIRKADNDSPFIILFGDSKGKLHALFLKQIDLTTVSTKQTVLPGQVELYHTIIGETSIPSCVTYLDAGYCYIGSTFGRPQLIKWHSDRVKISQEDKEKEKETEKKSTEIEVVEEFDNLGPIVDFAMVGVENQGQQQMLACCGGLQNGSFKIIRNGVGIKENLSAPLGSENLRCNQLSRVNVFTKKNANLKSILILSIVGGQTIAVGFHKEEGNESSSMEVEQEDQEEQSEVAFSQIQLPGLESNAQTLICENMLNNQVFAQITDKSVFIINSNSEKYGRICKWDEATSKKAVTITTAAVSNDGKILLSTSDKHLILLKLEKNSLIQKSNIEIPSSVSSIAISPYFPNLFACGFWDSTIGLYVETEINGKMQIHAIHSEALKQKDVIRSVLFVKFEKYHYLMYSLGKGQLFIQAFLFTPETNPAKIFIKYTKTLNLGKKEIGLKKFLHKGQVHVFASTDRPSIIYESHGKILFSNVNLSNIDLMSPYDPKKSPFFENLTDIAETNPQTSKKTSNSDEEADMEVEKRPEELQEENLDEESSIVYYKDGNVVFGSLESISKLHVETIDLNEQPRRVTFHQTTKTIIVSTVSLKKNIEENHLKLFSFGSKEQVGSFIFKQHEYASCMQCMFFGGKPSSSLKEKEKGSSKTTTQTKHGDQTDTDENTDEATKEGNERLDEFLVVGTAFVLPNESEPTSGRLLVFHLSPSSSTTSAGDSEITLTLVHEKDVAGAVNCMTKFGSDKLITGINSRVHIWRREEQMSAGQSSSLPKLGASSSAFGTGKEQIPQFVLLPVCHYVNSILVIDVKTKGDFILVCDLMRSICLLAFSEAHQKIDEIGRDYDSKWITCGDFISTIEPISSENAQSTLQVIVSENYYNLISFKKVEDVDEQKAKTLMTIGRFHLGDSINKMIEGNFVAPKIDEDEEGNKSDLMSLDLAASSASSSGSSESSSKNHKKNLIYATVNGAIGVIKPLSESQFLFLKALEESVAQVLHGIGGLTHENWRAFYDDRRTLPSEGFIDGDLVERILDAERSEQDKIVAVLNEKWKLEKFETDRVVVIIEELARSLH